MPPLRLLAILSHPDDESMALGGTLARYAREGAVTSLLTLTRGERGRYWGHRVGTGDHPGHARLGQIRERELQEAAAVLGVHDVRLLNLEDGAVDQAPMPTAIDEIASHVAEIRPHVVVTFGPDGAYGHPDHIATSQLAASAVVKAGRDNGHLVSKFYYLVWPQSVWDILNQAFALTTSPIIIDGQPRVLAPFPDWAVTTVVDGREHSAAVWRAIESHASQSASYEALRELAVDDRNSLCSRQSFYRVYSLVNVGRSLESDLFAGLRE